MAQSKFTEMAGKFPKGGPPGLTTGLKFLTAIGAAAYGVSQSLYTGKFLRFSFPEPCQHNLKSPVIRSSRPKITTY